MSKHAGSEPPVIPIDSTSQSRRNESSMVDTTQARSRLMTDSLPIVGMAGLSDAGYLRLEETDASLHPELEHALAALHDNLVTFCPKLLPLFRQLHNQIHTDRTRSLVEKSKLVGKIYEKHVVKKGSRMKEKELDGISRNEVESSREITNINDTGKKLSFHDLKRRARI